MSEDRRIFLLGYNYNYAIVTTTTRTLRGHQMRIAKLIGCSVVAIMAGMGPGAHASLIGSTFNENITISGSDDHGAYTITAFSGAVTVPGPGNFTATDAVFKQLTQ